LRNVNPDISLDLAEKGLKHARRCNSRYWEARNMMLMGIAWYKKGNFQKALFFLYPASSLWKNLQDTTGIIHSLINLGNVLESAGNFRKADSAYQRALEYAEYIRDMNMQCRILVNLSVLYYNAGQNKTAFGFLHKAHRLALTLNDYELLSMICSNAGGMLILQHSFSNARPWIEDAIKYYSLTYNFFGKWDALANLAQIEIHDKNYKTADSLLQLLQSYSAWMESSENRDIWLNLMIQSRLGQGDSLSAVPYLIKRMSLLDSMKKASRTENFSEDNALQKITTRKTNDIKINFLMALIASGISLILSLLLIKNRR
jgi:tetratricopeptide (TPR) repeat protein